MAKGVGGGNEMTREDAARIMSAEARSNGGQVEKGSFASRAQSAADRGQRDAAVIPKGTYATRLQSDTALANGGMIPKGSWAA